MSTGDVLSKLIKKYNLNALELERLTGIPASTIYRLLKNKDGNPTIEVLKKLSGFFQITVSQLIGEEPIGCNQIPLIPTFEISQFFNLSLEGKQKYRTIPVDFPMSTKSFATFSNDNTMEPFILKNSIIIVDPERQISNNDFVFLIKKEHDQPIIRKIIIDGDDTYIKMLNSELPIDLKVIQKKEYAFIGAIVHYRTNLFDFNKEEYVELSSYHSKAN